jgi:hypothetical protein
MRSISPCASASFLESAGLICRTVAIAAHSRSFGCAPRRLALQQNLSLGCIRKADCRCHRTERIKGNRGVAE